MTEIEVSLDDSSSASEEQSSIQNTTQSSQESLPQNETTKNNETTTSKPTGYDPVDVRTASPEQIEDRINYIYKQLRDGQKTNKAQERLLAEQSRLIGELSQSQNLVINHLQQKDIGDNEYQLTSVMKQAWERGDASAYNEAQNKLIELKVQKEKLKDQQRTQPQQTQHNYTQNERYDSASDIADKAVSNGELSESDNRITQAWQNERDDTGGQLRPWAYAGHPEFETAMAEGAAVFKSPRFRNSTFEQKLAEIDRRMGVAKRSGGQNVMGGSLRTSSKSTKVTLSPDIEKMVTRTKWGGDKYKSADERLTAYAKQIAQVRNNQKGVR